MKFLSRIFIIAVVLMGLISAGIWLKDRSGGEGDAPKGQPMATVERRDIESNLLLTGEVTPADQVDVKAEVGGKIKQLSVELGQTVKKGDLLAVIDDKDLQTEKLGAQTDIDGAQLAVTKTQGNYERAKALYEQKLISKEVYSNLQSDYEIAQNTLEKAERRMEGVQDKLIKTRILAPFNGTVIDLPVIAGQVVTSSGSVNSGTIIMKFANLSDLQIYSHVNQADAPRLSEGQPVEITVADGMAKPYKGHIILIAPLATVKNSVKGFNVRAEIEGADRRLKPGMSVNMNVPVGKADNAVSVPVTAVFRERKDDVVYVLKDGSTEKRQVTVGLTDYSFAEIKSGLKEGEEILLVEPNKS